MAQQPEITTISEKGQVVIPQGLRKNLGIKAKTKFVVFGKGDLIIMKKLQIPDIANEWAEIFDIVGKKRLGLSAKDVAREIRVYRKLRHRR